MSSLFIVTECQQGSEMVMIEGMGCYVPAETLDMLNQFRAEYNKCAALLPDSRYMDPPDGGSVEVSEQLRRMVEDLNNKIDQGNELLSKIYQSGADLHELEAEVRKHLVGEVK